MIASTGRPSGGAGAVGESASAATHDRIQSRCIGPSDQPGRPGRRAGRRRRTPGARAPGPRIRRRRRGSRTSSRPAPPAGRRPPAPARPASASSGARARPDADVLGRREPRPRGRRQLAQMGPRERDVAALVGDDAGRHPSERARLGIAEQRFGERQRATGRAVGEQARTSSITASSSARPRSSCSTSGPRDSAGTSRRGRRGGRSRRRLRGARAGRRRRSRLAARRRAPGPA